MNQTKNIKNSVISNKILKNKAHKVVIGKSFNNGNVKPLLKNINLSSINDIAGI
jgi:hypothetical protein